ncbi:MAG: hypothetical protein AAGD43_02890 [Pseudomonadota bacterium]
MRFLATCALVSLLLGGTASAQEEYAAGHMWGTDGSGVAVTGALSSAATHVQNGIVAGQVEAAKLGLLIANGDALSVTIQSIGSQSIIANNINGDNNTVSADNNTQTSDNSGDVTNDGEVNLN